MRIIFDIVKWMNIIISSLNFELYASPQRKGTSKKICAKNSKVFLHSGVESTGFDIHRKQLFHNFMMFCITYKDAYNGTFVL